MPTEILMPALSPTMEEGTLAKWLVKEGDTVSSGDLLAEIETDKATMEFEAVDDGVIGKILVAGGTENVAVNTPIALLLADGEDASALDQAAAKVVRRYRNQDQQYVIDIPPAIEEEGSQGEPRECRSPRQPAQRKVGNQRDRQKQENEFWGMKEHAGLAPVSVAFCALVASVIGNPARTAACFRARDEPCGRVRRVPDCRSGSRCRRGLPRGR